MRSTFLMVCLLCLIGASSVFGDDKYVGAIWTVKIKNKNTNKYDDFGIIRCATDGKVYRDGKIIGSHKNTGLDTVEMEITEAKDPKNNGIWKATRIKKDGNVWGGEFTRKSDGEKFAVALTLKKD